MSLDVANGRIRLHSDDPLHPFEVFLERHDLARLSFAISSALHEHDLFSEQDVRPVVDLVSPEISVSQDQMGVAVTFSGVGIGAMRMTLPLALALDVAQEIMTTISDALPKTEKAD